MGRNRSGGGRSFSDPKLILYVESCKNKYPTVDQMVEYLRATVPSYGRQKLQPFTSRVQQVMKLINNGGSANKNKSINHDHSSTSNFEDDHCSHASLQSPPPKKLKKIDRREEKLQRLETQHLLRRQKCQNQHFVFESSSQISTSSSSSDEVEDVAVSTSEDAVYSEKFEPEFDLMKSMLRASYNDSKNAAKSNVDVDGDGNNVEVEIINDRAKKLDLIQDGRTDANLGKGEAKGLNNSVGGGDSVGVEVKGKDGPTFKDLGGMTRVVEQLIIEVIVPLCHPELPQELGVRPMAGILLHGPPGCGKTKLAHAIANEAGVPFHKISATELVSGISGASEENIRNLFSNAYRTAPAIVFIDEIDAVASKRENLQREMERRIVTQLMTCMDESYGLVKTDDAKPNSEGSDFRSGYVLVIGATNRPDAIDPALRRPGRFDREFILGVPDEMGRVEILSVITRKLKLEGSFDLTKIARSTPGFVGADLASLAKQAGNLAMKRIIDQRKSEHSREPVDGEHTEEWWRRPWSAEEMKKLSITMADFEEAAKVVQPSSKREGFSAIPNVKWDDVGGLGFLRQEFERYIVRRIKNPEDYLEFGVDLEIGFLLYGPPGCGKTLIAKAVANEAGANFIHIKGPELLNKYVGESELAVRTIFSRARTCSPCILFFDEVDALTTQRGKEGGWVVERLLNQLLIELDGADQRQGVYVIGATNRPEVMDRAVLRPGRFGKLIYVPLPSPDERGLILKALARKKPIDASVDLIAVGRNEACENLSGADLAALLNEAAMIALEDNLTSGHNSDGTPGAIMMTHFERALEKITPSVEGNELRRFQAFTKSCRIA